MLITMQEQVDKEGEVTKEIGTDAAKLRTGIGATKNQGIKAFQNMADMMDKLFKDVETSYGSFCTNVISTLSTFQGETKVDYVLRQK